MNETILPSAPGNLVPNISNPGIIDATIGLNPGAINEGQYQYQQYNITSSHQAPQYQYPPHTQSQQQQQQQYHQQNRQPLITDNAIKIIGGVVIVLAGLWVVKSIFGNKSKQSRNTLPSTLRRPPRVRM